MPREMQISLANSRDGNSGPNGFPFGELDPAARRRIPFGSLMQFFGVQTSNPSRPRRRCRHKNLNDPLRRSDACCPTAQAGPI